MAARAGLAGLFWPSWRKSKENTAVVFLQIGFLQLTKCNLLRHIKTSKIVTCGMPECLWHVSSAHLEPFSIQFFPSFQMLEILCNCMQLFSTSFREKIRVFFGCHETTWPYANRNDHWRHYELWPPRRAGFVKDPTKVLQRFTTCPEFTKTTTHLTVEAQRQDNLNTNSSAQEKIRKIYIYIHLFQVSWSIVLTDQRLHLAFFCSKQSDVTFASLFSVLWIYPVTLFF